MIEPLSFDDHLQFNERERYAVGDYTTANTHHTSKGAEKDGTV